MVREAVTNILKHSSASYCVLEMTADARLLHLSISNDGRDDTGSGPLAEVGRTGNGLRNLAARLEAAGGDLTATRMSSSTCWTASCPSAVGGDTFDAERPSSAASTMRPDSPFFIANRS